MPDSPAMVGVSEVGMNSDGIVLYASKEGLENLTAAVATTRLRDMPIDWKETDGAPIETIPAW